MDIKFRAWSKVHGKMCQVQSINFHSVYGNMLSVFIDISPFTVRIVDVELMQCTGLKDKNGVEIYQDDIVIADWHWEGPHRIIWPDDYYDLVEYGLDASEHLQVIGNIYQNHELLQR